MVIEPTRRYLGVPQVARKEEDGINKALSEPAFRPGSRSTIDHGLDLKLLKILPFFLIVFIARRARHDTRFVYVLANVFLLFPSFPRIAFFEECNDAYLPDLALFVKPQRFSRKAFLRTQFLSNYIRLIIDLH